MRIQHSVSPFNTVTNVGDIASRTQEFTVSCIWDLKSTIDMVLAYISSIYGTHIGFCIIRYFLRKRKTKKKTKIHSIGVRTIVFNINWLYNINHSDNAFESQQYSRDFFKKVLVSAKCDMLQYYWHTHFFCNFGKFDTLLGWHKKTKQKKQNSPPN